MSEQLGDVVPSFYQPPRTAEFLVRAPEVAGMYRESFGGYPWFEDLSMEEASARIDAHIQRPGFEAFLSTGDDGTVEGALWYDTPTLDELAAERGEALREFAQTRGGNRLIAWEREVLVSPAAQGKGLATELRRAFLQGLSRNNPDTGALALTRMRDDNFGIVRIAQKLGFQRTGIKMQSSQNPDTMHEYWYCEVPGVNPYE